ncbi:MAG: hypothetical protein AB1649_16720, partial [Chloroflexota bacterium]
VSAYALTPQNSVITHGNSRRTLLLVKIARLPNGCLHSVNVYIVGRLGSINMALKANLPLITFSLIFILLTLSFPSQPARALDVEKTELPVLELFISEVMNGRPEELRGVYIPNVLAARVVQQPAGSDNFVSSGSKDVTQFAQASRLGSTGLLAHNYLAGASFSLMQEGRDFYLVYGDGHTAVFEVTDTLQYQALQPTSILSEFVSLEDGSRQTASEVFSEVYGRPGQVVLQTCIAADGNPSWGRLFVIAEPDTFTGHATAPKARHFYRPRRK